MIIQKELKVGFAGEEDLELGNIKWVHKRIENNAIYHEAKFRRIDFILTNELVRVLKTKAASPLLLHKTNLIIGVYLQTIGIAAPRIDARFAVVKISAKAKRSRGNGEVLRNKSCSLVQAGKPVVGLVAATASKPGILEDTAVGSMRNDIFTSCGNKPEFDGEKENSSPSVFV